MKPILTFLVAMVLLYLSGFIDQFLMHENSFKEIQNPDTCIIQGMVFKFVHEDSPQELSAIIRNERVEVVTDNKMANYRVIRYVFSIMRDEKFSLVRSYGSLVSYPVIQNLKISNTGDRFYFEEIVVVDDGKEIQNNLIKPIIIERTD